MSEPMELRTDPAREGMAETGVFVRAKRTSTDRWDSVDMIELDKESLVSWLRSRVHGAEQCLLLLLGYPYEK